MQTLYFDCDGALEVCGPTNFGPNDARLEITLQLDIVDQFGNRLSAQLPIITNAPAQEWECEIPGAKGILAAGPATGTASGRIVKKQGQGQSVPVTWVGSFTLVDGCVILQNIAPRRVARWRAYRRRVREYWP